MDYPLIIDGLEKGRLRITQEGLYTVYEAELNNVQEGMFRLWLHGGGDCAYLGLMQPWSGGMYLRRKLSRREQESFPKNIEFASNQENLCLHNKGEAPKEEAPSCPYPAPIAEDGDELQWFTRPDGSLVCFDGISSLVALPVKLRRAAPGAVLRRIAGREYMIFRY